MTITAAIDLGVATGLDRLDAQMLLLHALGRSPYERAWLHAHGDEPVNDPAVAERYALLCRRRRQGEPAAYIVGRKEFFGLGLVVDPRVLVPRPETELLVDWALELLKGREAPRVIDLGTGSGAIALAIKHSRPDATVEAIDASMDALAVAKLNAKRLGFPIAFRQASWLGGTNGPYDVIVSNPPYVADGDPHLAALTYEPPAALAAGADGLADLRRIVREAPPCLAPGGWLIVEHGHDQGVAVAALMTAAGFENVGLRRDLAGHARCTGGRVGEKPPQRG